MKKPVDVTIVGGGVVGLCSAYFLNRAGMSVRILEKDRVGHGASLGNMGLITPSHATALCTPANLKSGLGSLFNATAPLKISLSPDLRRLRWLSRFAAQCSAQRAAEVMGAKAAILSRSRQLTEKMIGLERLDCEFEACGLLAVAKTDQGLDHLHQLAAAVEPLGVETEALSDRELLRREPALRGELAGGVLFPADAVLNPGQFCDEMKKRIETKGVEIIEDCAAEVIHAEGDAVESVYTSNGLYPAKRLVVTTGAWSSELLRTIGINVPVEPGKGYSLTTTRHPSPCPSHALLLEERSMAVTPWASGYRIGGTMEFSGFDDSLNKTRLNALIDGAAEYMLEPIPPGPPEYWAGFRPMTPDDLPIIGPAGPRNLFVACGHNMLGMSMAASTGRLVTELVMDRKPHLDIRPYDPRRFAKQPNNPFTAWWRARRAS